MHAYTTHKICVMEISTKYMLTSMLAINRVLLFKKKDIKICLYLSMKSKLHFKFDIVIIYRVYNIQV